MAIDISQESFKDLLELFVMGLRKSIMNWFESSYISVRMQLKLLERVLEEIGKMWGNDEISLTQIYVISKITEELSIKYIAPENKDSLKKEKGTIILGTMQDDNHALGKNIIKRFLEPFFNVEDLGINVKIKKFIEKAQEHQADIIAISSLMMTSVEEMPKIKEEIDIVVWQKKKPKLLVGGAPFTIDSNLFKRIKADATASNAFEVVDVCLKLMEGRK